MKLTHAHLACQAAVLAILCLTACSNDDPDTTTYLPQTSEDNVLENLVRAYNDQDIEGYSRLFASDYQFYPDAATRTELGLEFWTRTTDSLQTEALFNSPLVGRIDLALEWRRGSATGTGFQPIRDNWTKQIIDHMVFEGDVTCPGRELTTFRLEERDLRIFFRRGHTYPPSGPADTLTYIIEWRPGTPASKPSASEPATVPVGWWDIMSAPFDCE